MNLTLAIAVYANICKALGLPLSFPGKPGAYTALYQCTDAALLAKAVEWMATDPKCANQAFNITNSDLIRWQNLWPKFANFFGMELAPPRHINLARSMADKGPIWDKIVEKNGLQKYRFEEIAAWGYPDGVFARITISSPIRARPAVSDSTTWWTLRRCFFGCFQIFGVTRSYRDYQAFSQKDRRSRLNMRTQTMRATLNGQVIAESDDIEVGADYKYFPASANRLELSRRRRRPRRTSPVRTASSSTTWSSTASGMDVRRGPMKRRVRPAARRRTVRILA